MVLLVSGLIDKLKALIVNKYSKSLIRRLIPRLTVGLTALQLEPELVERFIGDLTIVTIAVAAFIIELVFSWIDKKKNQE